MSLASRSVFLVRSLLPNYGWRFLIFTAVSVSLYGTIYLVVVVEPHGGASGALPGVGQVLVDLPAWRHALWMHDAVAHRALPKRRRPVATWTYRYSNFQPANTSHSPA